MMDVVTASIDPILPLMNLFYHNHAGAAHQASFQHHSVPVIFLPDHSFFHRNAQHTKRNKIRLVSAVWMGVGHGHHDTCQAGV